MPGQFTFLFKTEEQQREERVQQALSEFGTVRSYHAQHHPHLLLIRCGTLYVWVWVCVCVQRVGWVLSSRCKEIPCLLVLMPAL